MRILLIDDDSAVLDSLEAVLAGAGHGVVPCRGGAEALAALREPGYDLVVTDLRMPPPDGFAVLRAAHAHGPAPAVIVVTAVDTARSAVEALGSGARDYLVKPLDPADLLAAVARMRDEMGGRLPGQDFGLVGRSDVMRRVHSLIPLLAGSREAVLIVGETGVGKDLLARVIHEQGPRSRGPFVAHNMAATPSELAESLFFGHERGAFSGASGEHAGLFEQADGGTLFMDEVDSFPLHLQAKLLRVLEGGHVRRLGAALDRPVDVRLISASATSLGEQVARGSFRADLYYRLRQLEVLLPPLRERREDIPPLVRHFLAELAGDAGRPMSISRAAMDFLSQGAWPGNCRELRHTVRTSALMATGGPILPAHLSPGGRPSAPVPSAAQGVALCDVERAHVLRILEQARGNRSLAARLLGIDRGTLARKLRAMGRPDGPR